MQNLSISAIITLFLKHPSSVYVNKSSGLQFNDNVLFSYDRPLAIYDPLADTFVTTYYPPTYASSWAIRHHVSFQRQCPQAVRVPTLNPYPSAESIRLFYEYEISKFPPKSLSRTNLEHHYNVVKEYLAKTGSDLSDLPTPHTRKEITPPPSKLQTAADVGTKSSYEELVYYYTKDPDQAGFCGRLHTTYDSLDLIYLGVVMARYYPEYKLFAVRAYDLRPRHKAIINQLIAHTTASVVNPSVDHILVAEAGTPLTDTDKTLAQYVQRMADIAEHLLQYQRDAQAPRRLAKIFHRLAESRDRYIKLMKINYAVPTYIPDPEALKALKRYGAYRTEPSVAKD